MADNFQITEGSGTTIAADQASDSFYYQKIKLVDATADSTTGTGISSNPLRVDPTGTTTQPVSGPLTDTQLRTTPVPVSGTITTTPSGTQTVSGSVSVSNFPATQPVSGTFFQATQPISAASLPLPSGAATEASLGLLNAKLLNSTLAVTATAATGVAVTATLPAVASQSHNITFLEITAYSTVARVGGAVPIVVTTTNLPGSPAYSFATAAAIGTTDRYIIPLMRSLVASVANTATTIVCPATVSVIWRINVHYYTV